MKRFLLKPLIILSLPFFLVACRNNRGLNLATNGGFGIDFGGDGGNTNTGSTTGGTTGGSTGGSTGGNTGGGSGGGPNSPFLCVPDSPVNVLAFADQLPATIRLQGLTYKGGIPIAASAVLGQPPANVTLTNASSDGLTAVDARVTQAGAYAINIATQNPLGEVTTCAFALTITVVPRLLCDAVEGPAQLYINAGGQKSVEFTVKLNRAANRVGQAGSAFTLDSITPSNENKYFTVRGSIASRGHGFAHWVDVDFDGIPKIDASDTASCRYQVTELNPVIVQRRNFIRSLYTGILGRDGSNDEVLYWDGHMAAGTTSHAVAHMFAFSDERIRRIVDLVYRQFLKRGAEPAAMDQWAAHIRANGSDPLTFQAHVLNSNEYWARTGSNVHGFVHNLYLDVLRRDPEPGAVDAWATHTFIHGRYSTALQILRSEEYRRRVIHHELYVAVLGRTPSVGEVTGWYTNWVNGSTNERHIYGEFYGSPEYYARHRVE